MPLDVSDASFEVEILDRSESITVVVEFWAPWCGPCSALGPILTQAVSEAAREVASVRVNVDESPQLAAYFDVKSIPVVIAVHQRQVVNNFIGAQEKEVVRRFIETLPSGSAPSQSGDPDHELRTVERDGVLPNHTAELLEASRSALETIAAGRKRLAAACSQRTQDEKTFEARSTQQEDDYDARVACLDEYANKLEERMRSAAGWGKASERVMGRAVQEAQLSDSRPAVDASVTRRDPRPLAEINGVGIAAADVAISAASTAASKTRKGVMSKVLNTGSLVDELTTARCVVLSAHEKSEALEFERPRAASALANERSLTKARNDQAVQAAAQNLEESVATRCVAYEGLLAASPPVARPGWDPDEWKVWSPPDTVEPIYLGRLGAPPANTQQEFADLPTNLVSLTDDIRRLGGILYTYKDVTRLETLSAARSLVARLLASIPPGKARFTFFDPLGLGEAVAPFLALADHDQKLIDGKVWSSVDELRPRLTEHMNHIEVVIQKYLRGEYESIEQYNREAGEIAEPYRFLFVYDYPSQFDETTVHQLSRIIENGPRCGVYTVVLANADTRPPHGASIQALPELFSVAPSGPLSLYGLPPMTMWYDVDPIEALGTAQGQAVIDRIVDLVGRTGRGADNVTVDLPKALRLHGETVRAGVRSDLPAGSNPAAIDDVSTWWANTSVEAVAAPIGQSGARDVALLRFDSEILSGGLLVGRPGAGKSTLLHSYLGGLCSLYPPEELELYLIDFKEGVEFKAYAEFALPHARCVAVETERDFGVSVLESIVAEMKRRAELIRSTGGEQTSFARLREALSYPLPRIVLVFDEFHVLFSEDDKVGATAADHLETIIRQGRGFGVHVLLSSQSLAGLDALGRHVLQLLPIRVLLPSAESDAHLLLGDGNDAWRMLNRRGEGILNIAAGAVEANVPFQAAFEAERDRIERLQRLRMKANEAGATRCPVVFEGYGASDITATSTSEFLGDFSEWSPLTIPFRVGTPMALAGPIDVELRREGGGNLIVVSRGSHDVPLGVTLTGVTSAAASAARPRIEFVDFTAVDDGVEDALKPLQDASLVSLTRRRSAERSIGELAAEVARRVDEDDVRAPAVLLVLYGLHRARDLDAAPESFETETTEDLLTSLNHILVEGPEVGVHVVAWVDSVGSLSRRLPRRVQREFGTVIVGNMSREDSMELIDIDVAASLKSHQIAVYNDDAGIVQRGRSYSVPTAEWLEAISAQVGQTGPNSRVQS